jgi:hypothetical protein
MFNSTTTTLIPIDSLAKRTKGITFTVVDAIEGGPVFLSGSDGEQYTIENDESGKLRMVKCQTLAEKIEQLESFVSILCDKLEVSIDDVEQEYLQQQAMYK